MSNATGGSFTNLSQLREKAQDDRDQRVEAQRRAEEEAKQKKDATDKPAEPKVPIHTSMIYGPMTLDDLFAKYPTVHEQVKNKNYFLQSYVTYDMKLGTTVVSLRTLRKSEQRVISLLAEGGVVDGEQMYHPDDLNRWTLVFSLTKLGQVSFEPLAVPDVNSAKRFIQDTDKRLQEFIANPDVQKRMAVVGEWSPAVYAAVLSAFNDVNATYQQAIIQDMRNPS